MTRNASFPVISSASNRARQTNVQPRRSNGEGVYAELKNLIVWVKDNGGMGTFYRSRHELIFAFKNGTAPHINSFELGQHGRYRTNVWQYRGVNQRAQRLFTQILAATETANKRLHDEWLETAITYKTEWESEIERCRRQGIEPPNPLPHPDDIVIDMRTGTVRIKGPMTPEEKKEWDWLRERKVEFEKELTELQQLLIDEPDCDYRRVVEDDIARTEKLLAMFRRAIPD
jgi:hypothetical protein